MGIHAHVLKNRVIAASIILILLCLTLLVMSTRFPPSPQPEYPGPSAFPVLVMAGIILCCLILIYRELTQKDRGETTSIDWRNPDIHKTVFILVITVVYVLLLGTLNFFALTLCLLIVSMQTLKSGGFPEVLWTRSRLRLILITSLCVTGGIYFLFDKFLQIPLP